MNTDIQQNASANAQQNLDAQTDQLLGIINTYVQQFDATSDDTSEIPAIEDVLEELDNHMPPLFDGGLQQARYGVQKTKAKDSQRGGQLKAEVLKRLSGFQDYIRHIITCFLKGYHYKAQPKPNSAIYRSIIPARSVIYWQKNARKSMSLAG